MGIRNSSLTRVQPVLDSLHAFDPTGTNCLLPLLRLASRSNRIADDFVPGQLSTPPRYEFSAPPPREFLRFLLANPATLAAPPEGGWRKWNEITQVNRRAFLAGDTFIQREGLRSLDAARDLSEGAWWRFEGVTSVDCALFTASTVVFIEGKRTEDGLRDRDVVGRTQSGNSKYGVCVGVGEGNKSFACLCSSRGRRGLVRAGNRSGT